jgi:hypothetical protein
MKERVFQVFAGVLYYWERAGFEVWSMLQFRLVFMETSCASESGFKISAASTVNRLI